MKKSDPRIGFPKTLDDDQSESGEVFGGPKLTGEQFIVCAEYGEVGAIKHYIDKGGDVNFRDGQGMTALHHLAARGSRPSIRLLVGCGRCNYLIQDNHGRYAFQLAYEWGKDYAVARLLEKKQAQQARDFGVPAWVDPTTNMASKNLKIVSKPSHATDGLSELLLQDYSLDNPFGVQAIEEEYALLKNEVERINKKELASRSVEEWRYLIINANLHWLRDEALKYVEEALSFYSADLPRLIFLTYKAELIARFDAPKAMIIYDEILDVLNEQSGPEVLEAVANSLCTKIDVLSRMSYQYGIDACDELIATFQEHEKIEVQRSVLYSFLSKADSLSGLKKYHEAIAVCDEALRRFHGYTDVRFTAMLIRVNYRKADSINAIGNVEAALAICDDLIDRFKDRSEFSIEEKIFSVRMQKADFLRSLNKIEEAIQIYTDLIDQFSGRSEIHFMNEAILVKSELDRLFAEFKLDKNFAISSKRPI